MVARLTKVVDAKIKSTEAGIRATADAACVNAIGIAVIVGATGTENSTHALNKAGSTDLMGLMGLTGLGFRHRSNT
jgi:hypothetical protein